ENGCSARWYFRDDGIVREYHELADNELEKFTHVFFFQAEDGIRAFHVTGVQTCALPIFADQSSACSERRGKFVERSIGPCEEDGTPRERKLGAKCRSGGDRRDELGLAAERAEATSGNRADDGDSARHRAGIGDCPDRLHSG